MIDNEVVMVRKKMKKNMFAVQVGAVNRPKLRHVSMLTLFVVGAIFMGVAK